MSCGVAIFVKTPSLSAVKTRLWPGLGRPRAQAFYLISAAAVASVAQAAQRGGGLHAYWAVAEALTATADAWRGLPRIAQGEGSLGERMARVYGQLRQRHRGAVLIGADTPQLVPAALERAAHWLESDENRLVIGPACDGGFWLFGGNAELPQSSWLAPRYSAATTADEFVTAMHGHGRWLQLEALRDIDTVEDLTYVRADLAALVAPTPPQQRLLAWLQMQSMTAMPPI